MEEKRKIYRRHLIYYLRVFDIATGNLLGHLVDITTEGIMLISETPIETGLTFQLRMDLPAFVFGKPELHFEARSVWCQSDVNTDFYDTGFQLIDISEQDQHIIEQIIEEYGFRY